MNKKDYDHIQFRQGLPFFEIVMSFMTSLSTVSFILNNDKLINLKEQDWVSLEGKWVAPRHFYPNDVVSNIKRGQFTFDTYINVNCCMHANIAYEAVKERNDKSPEFELLRHIRNASSHSPLIN